MQDARCRIQDTGYKMQDTRCRITEGSEKDIIIKDLYYINDLAYENTEKHKLLPQTLTDFY